MIAVVIAVVMIIIILVEVEEVEQVPDGGHVARHVVIGVAVMALDRIWQVVAAARRKLGMEQPVSLDELYE